MSTEEPLGPIARLIEELSKLPGVGPKSAERMTHFLLTSPRAEVFALADALRDVKEKIRRCVLCCNLTEQEKCEICSNPKRDPTIICVVEQPWDLRAIERAGSYRGTYHVLHGRHAPLENVDLEQLTIDRLLQRVQLGEVREIIMATNPTFEGDGTAIYLSSLLESSEVPITKLARGLASGLGLEHANNQMLAEALEGRREL